MKRVRVLITDDSNLMRKLLTNIVGKDSRLEVVGTAENGKECLEKVKELKPDVVTLDLNMPVMDGLTCLKESRAQDLQTQTAYLVVSSLAQKDAQITIDAINEGAVDYIPKPSQMLGISALEKEIVGKILMAYESKQTKDQPAAPEHARTGPLPPHRMSGGGAAAALATAQATPLPARPAGAPAPGPVPAAAGKPRLTIIGGSSGSMRVVQKIAPAISPKFNGVVVFVLHLPAFFTSQLAAALQKVSPIPVEEAKEGVPLALKRIYIAPGGDKNVILTKNPAGKGVMFKLVENDQMLPLTPSIDVFMTSASQIFRDACRGVLISGIGNDGIEGLKTIRAARGETFAQDKQSAVAAQLPLAAVAAGVVGDVLNIQQIVDLLQ